MIPEGRRSFFGRSLDVTLRIKFLTLIAALTVSFGFAEPPVKVTVEHNSNNDASASFKFKSVPSPAKDDAATKAKLTLDDGDMDSKGPDLSALTDVALSTEHDE